jgi:hypothetical protein
MLLYLLTTEACTKNKCRALVVNGHVRRRYLIVVPRPLPAAPLVAHRRYLIVVSLPLPAAPLVVRRRYLIVVPRPSPRLLDCGAQTDSRGAVQVIDCGAKAVARSAARCAPQVRNPGAQAATRGGVVRRR